MHWSRCCRPDAQRHKIHYSDKGSQYVSLAFAQQLKMPAGLAIGSTGDSYNNTMADSINGIYKAEMDTPTELEKLR